MRSFFFVYSGANVDSSSAQIRAIFLPSLYITNENRKIFHFFEKKLKNFEKNRKRAVEMSFSSVLLTIATRKREQERPIKVSPIQENQQKICNRSYIFANRSYDFEETLDKQFPPWYNAANSHLRIKGFVLMFRKNPNIRSQSFKNRRSCSIAVLPVTSPRWWQSWQTGGETSTYVC